LVEGSKAGKKGQDGGKGKVGVGKSRGSWEKGGGGKEKGREPARTVMGKRR